MLHVSLLGHFELIRDGRRLTIPTRNGQSLFAYLVLNAGKAFRREHLAGLLWPDSSEENARSNLRHELWRLRKAIEKDAESCFIIDELTIAFDPHSNFSLDVHTLENPALDASIDNDLTRSLSAYQGELLPGFYEEWVSFERGRLAVIFEAKIARLLELLESQGRWAEVIGWSMRWISLGQWPEPAYRALMAAYANTGDLAKAAATFERFSLGLQKDLGIQPSEQTRSLYKRIKAGWKLDVKKATPQAHRPPQKSTHHMAPPTYALPKVRRSNVPKPLTSFIGREREVEQVQQLVARGRLVTITGPGGVGKTRLAIHVAEALTPQFHDGVWWVELAPLFSAASPERDQPQADPVNPGSGSRPLASQALQTPAEDLPGVSLVAQAIAKALRMQENPGLSPLDGVVEHLGEMHLLLVLDNCEHLIEACAALAGQVLGDCPQVTILATSREALKVPGEKAWLLPSLSLPRPAVDIRDIYQSEAVSLFLERAADALPGYQPTENDAQAIAQICLRLDGIPLAIELAAARMNLLSPQEIAARLEGRFSLLTGGSRTGLPRHQTLQATIDWSYGLLSPPEQVLFRRLTIFSGSFTLEAAEAICTGQGIHSDEVLTLLARLVDKSLLVAEPLHQDTDLPTRYRFLDTICSFGRAKLEDAAETQRLRQRHAAYFVRLVESAEAKYLLENQMRWYKLLQAEMDNIRTVVEWSATSDQAESALRMVGALLWFMYVFGSHREGCELALKALAAPSAVKFKEARARALNTAGYLQCVLGDTTSARRTFEEALSILKTSHDNITLAWTMQFLGLAYSFDREYELADTAFREGLAIGEGVADVNANSFLFFLGDLDQQKGDRTRARKIYEESANIYRTIGNKSFLAYPLRRLGYLELEEKQTSQAWKYFRESLDLNYEVGDNPGLTSSLVSIAHLAVHLGQPLIAARLFGAVESRLEKLSIYLLVMDQAELGRLRQMLFSLLDEQAFTAVFTQGWEMGEEQAVRLALEVYDAQD